VRGCNAPVSELPTGTVSLLFSDIEGSTALLKRLVSAYTEALDGQRQVLRKAWADHQGLELGTEGDSFYVVFPTAEGAVAAAAQGQRDLEGFEWPEGETVRVRMGVHTGSPAVHDGAYVGMDVHRAARIAGAAHGGQVLVSQATAALVSGCLPDGVAVRDLGVHQLKDIPSPEHLFQVNIEGLQVDFPRVKSLGASSSLPRSATPLVGRDGELAELVEMLSSPEVRLLTLTGPGGSGKTRLAIGVAERLVDELPDGVYFVPLAAVTTTDVMWTSMAEVLGVPSEGRTPPGFFDHVAHRNGLFVLDNLEQLVGAQQVVEELLEAAPHVVVIATSRRPLHVSAEHEHPVPPLVVPEQATLSDAQASGAVQLFVQQARKVRPSFQLSTDNAADVVELCRRLDGLPLAVELTAARSKLLTPKALVARLDQALDIAASDMRSLRHRTLRDTITWSYNLLTPIQRAFFRHLGVFAGGADLEAITAVTADVLHDRGPFELVADLVDASLLTVADDYQGEPRLGMLETIRSFAITELEGAGDLVEARSAHAEHYLMVAEVIRDQLLAGVLDSRMLARRRFELEHDNVREALTSTTECEHTEVDSQRLKVALRLCAALREPWGDGGYYAEAGLWLERVIALAGDQSDLMLARCLLGMATFTNVQGHREVGREFAARAVRMCRELGEIRDLVDALSGLARCHQAAEHLDLARPLFEEAVALAREVGDDQRLAVALNNLGMLQSEEQEMHRALETYAAAVEISSRLCPADDGSFLRGTTVDVRPDDAVTVVRRASTVGGGRRGLWGGARCEWSP
jgi:predicted ATPase/class 3 adenylate cyclase